MSKKKLSVIVIISIMLNIGLIWFASSVHHENNKIKEAIILQYSTQQSETLAELERALDADGDEVEFIKGLTSAYGMIYHNDILTRPYTSAGHVIGIPENIFNINSNYTSQAVGSALFDQPLSNEEIVNLETYTSYVAQIVKKLDYHNKIEGQTLKQQYKVLDEVSELIDGFNLGN